MSNEVLDLLACGFAQSLDPTKISSIGLHQVGIELVLPDDLAQAIADLWASVVPVSRLRRELARLLPRLRGMGSRSDFLDRADADTVCLAQCTVDGSRLCHAHLGAVDQGRDIGRICVSESNESSTAS